MPRPTFQKSRGPNGRHLAPLTPYPDDSGLVITTIKPSGALVANGGGLRAYTTKDFQDGWDIVNARAGRSGWGMVLMEPGFIIGLGGGFNDDPALLDVGGVRDNRILYWPTKGWGGVSLTGLSAKITNPNGWTLGGVRGGAEHDLGWLIVSADNFSLWRCTGQYLNSNGASGQVSTGCDFVECVVPNSWVFETDTAAVRGATVTAARPTPGPITGTNYIGCYLAPTWKPVNSGAHTDTLQWSGDSPYGDSIVEDCVVFASTNHGLIAGGAATDITVRNTAVIGGQVNLKRYPSTGIAAPGSKFPGRGPEPYNDPYVLNGTGAPGEMAIYDSLFIGRMTNLQNLRQPGGVVSNVQITAQAAKDNDARFTLVPSFSSWTAADLDREFPFPSDARLASIWAVGAIIPTDPTTPTDPTNPTNPTDPTAPTTPTGALAQNTMPSYAQAWALATAPTIAFSTAATVTGVKVAPTDAKVVHTGAAAKAIVAAATTGYYRPNYLADIDGAGSSTNPRLMPAYGTKIRTSSAVVEIALQQRPDLVGGGVTTRTPIRIKVNGQWTSRMPTFVGADGNIGYDGMTPSFVTAGTKFWLKLTFATAVEREIEIQSMLEYAGWTVPTGQTFKAATPVKHTIVWDMDSLSGGEKHGTGNYSLSAAEGSFQHATYTHLSSLAWYASQTLGYDSVVNSSAGSSGYNISGDTVKFITEARGQFDVIDHNPELVVVGCGFNDVAAGQTTAQIQTHATTTLNQIKAGVPNAIRVILGLPSIPAAAVLGGASALAPYNTALKAAAKATGAWFLDPILGDLFNPAGVRIADKANMVTGNESKISSDKTHPTQAGADFFGSGYVAEMLRLVHPAVSTGGPVTPPVSQDDPVVEWVTDNAAALPKTALLVVNATPADDIESVAFEAIYQGRAVALPGATRGAGNNWAVTFNTTALATGSYPVNATAKHRNGKTATESRTFSIVNDTAAPNKAPVVTALAPQSGMVLPRTGQTVFRGRATDDLYVSDAAFRFRKAGVLEDPKAAAPAVVENGVYELTVDNATLIGYNGYTFLASDTGGLTTETALIPFSTAPIIDTTPPSDFTLTVAASKPGELIAEWTESVKVGQAIAYRVLFNGLEIGSKQSGRVLAIAPIDPGTKPTIQVVASDENGYRTYSNEVSDVEVAGQPPVVTPSVNTTKITYSWVGFVDSRGVDGYDLYFDGQKVNSALYLAQTYTTPAQPADSTHTFYVVAKLATGVSATSNTVTSAIAPSDTTSPPVVDTTPPAGGITDPVDGSVVVPPFQRVRFSASDPHSGISSVSLRSSTLGEIAQATLVSPGIYEADLSVDVLPYGTTAVFARIINGAGLVFNSPSITLTRETPAVTEQGYVEIAPPILNTAGEPVMNGHLTIEQRVRFPNGDGFITKAPINVEVTDGEFRIDGVTKNIRVAIPPLEKGLRIVEDGSDLPYVDRRAVGLPPGTTSGTVIQYKALVDLIPTDEASDAIVPPGVAEALAAVTRVELLVADLELQQITVGTTPEGFGRLTIGA